MGSCTTILKFNSDTTSQLTESAGDDVAELAQGIDEKMQTLKSWGPEAWIKKNPSKFFSNIKKVLSSIVPC